MNGVNTYKSGYASLIGKPNVGKSTLLNKLVSVKIAATSDKPQTTRNKITGIGHFSGGQVILLDTPGIHKSSSKLNRFMFKTSLATLTDVDLILFIVDVSKEFCEEDEYAMEVVRGVTTPKILVLNKIDLVPKPQLLPLMEKLSHKGNYIDTIPVSALYNDGLDLLVKVLLDHLPIGPKYFPLDIVTENSDYFLISEVIREKIVRLTRFELPYASAVVVSKVEKGKKGVTVIESTIFAERASQKKILIGEKGNMLKRIGSQARKEIEKRFGKKTYLNLHVKVKNKWRENDYFLKEFGYTI